MSLNHNLKILIIGVFFLVGCSQDSTPVRIGYIPIADCAQIYIAKDRGLFEKHGVEVELIPLAGGARILEALVGESIEIGFSNVVSFILAREAGLDIIALSGGPVETSQARESAILVRKGSAIETAKDLTGAKIAVNTRKNIVELILLEYLKKNGVIEDQVEFVEVPFPSMVSVLIQGDVDAIAVYEPFVTLGLQTDELKVIDYHSVKVLDPICISTYNCRGDWLDLNSKKIRAIREALAEASIIIEQEEGAVRQAIVNYTSLTPEVAWEIGLPEFKSQIDNENLLEIANMIFNNGWISGIEILDGAVVTK